MKKIFLILSICFFSLASLAQEKKHEISYKSEYMGLGFINSKNEVVNEKPFGRDVKIIYDNFFKSYYIEFYKEDGTYSYYKFYFVSNNPDKSLRMRTENNSISNILDTLTKDGTLLIVKDKRFDDGLLGYLVIRGSTRIE